LSRLNAISGSRMGRREQDVEAAAPELGLELPEPISSLMVPNFVGSAPQRGVLRDRDDRSATHDGRAAQAPQHGLVICNMLDDVEGAGKVEGVEHRYCAGIHLHEFDLGRQARACVL